MEIVEFDLNDRAAHAGAIQRASAILGTIDTVIVTAAAFAVQEQLEDDATLLARVLDTDFTDTVLFCEAARKTLLAAGGGTLCVFSRVVLRGINKGTPVVYAPAVWQWVMLVIRNLPRFVMRRIGF